MKEVELRLAENGIPETNQGDVLVLPTPKEPYLLRIALSGTSPVANAATLYCNYPPSGSEFDRTKFYEHKFNADALDRDCCINLEIFQSGAFSAYVEYTAVKGPYSAEKHVPSRSTEWNFVVESGAASRCRGEVPNSDAMCVQTVLSKLMGGPASSWDEKLAAIADKGYNMIHFVPMQPRGRSDSPFSIFDQLSWDKTTFPNGDADVAKLVQTMQDKYGMLALSDIVLNHTADNSKWIVEHPEVGYSVENSPYLEPALALEDGILELSDELGKKGVEIHNEGDLDKIMDTLGTYIDKEIKLWQFYVVPTDGLSSDTSDKKVGGLDEAAAKLAPKNSLGSRFGRKIPQKELAEVASNTGYSEEQLVNAVNVRFYAEYHADLSTIITQIRGRLKFLRFEQGPPNSSISRTSALVEPYFTRLSNGIALANNGWIWGASPTTDFASSESRAYLLRQIVIWDDCVKLRYGKGPDDCPYLWDRMASYAQLLAKHFAGLRLDNAHSTPLHVGEYILDAARRVRPDLYVVAELFSGSQDVDKLYIERLGINSLLREAMGSSSASELSSLIHANIGAPIGSFRQGRRLGGVPVHAWLMEVTHDNETPAQKFTVEDTLPIAGLVAMCKVTSGSTMGADECYPNPLNVVSETRQYVFGGGIAAAKKKLNNLHVEMARMGMTESYLDHQGSYISVHRVNPETGEGYFLIARLKWDGGDATPPPSVLEKTKATFIHGWNLRVTGQAEQKGQGQICPVPTELVELESPSLKFDGANSVIDVDTNTVPAGSVVIFSTTRTFDTTKIEKLVDDVPPLDNLTLLQLNTLLYRTAGEERVASNGERGTYGIPNYGDLVYAGLQGWQSVLSHIVAEQNLGHALCDNLRAGPWAFEYVSNRLRDATEFKDIVGWLDQVLKLVSDAPTFLRPRYFAACILGLYDAAVLHALNLLGAKGNSNIFYQRLVLSSVQFVAAVSNVSLHPDRLVPTMAAGLPHFSEGIMRTWGRDTFLSFGGLLLIPGRLDEAKEHILGFGATLKYGLIPNLLDSGRNPRYNARDAAWFFVQSVQDYCTHAKSFDILNDTVRRRFPLDDSWTEEPTDTFTKVGDLVFEILARHAKTINFREHNAGKQIDEHMKDNGFNQHIDVDWKTGFIAGGNHDNCGTWQDKMGESQRAGNDGVPGTPRDGAAIEIIGLLKSCLRWVRETRTAGHYAFPTEVVTRRGDSISLEHWEKRIQESFEFCFYVPETPEEAYGYDVDFSLVNRKGIYKDLYRSWNRYEDYQLRPNFCIAAVVAPELFNPSHLAKALKMADEVLRGPVGMATLDPSDWNYRPYYINGSDTDDFATSRGRNYHQGPEWVWLEGMFLQALTISDSQRGVPLEKTLGTIRARISGNVKWIQESPWAGLTELTQKNGEFCPDSSPSQAWSSARMIEALNALGK